jgi:hippurate hydrolase
MTFQQLLNDATKLQPELAKLRRELHQNPEFGLSLPKTLALVLNEISELGEVTLSSSISSAVLHIKGGKPGPTVLLRCDMDALAVIEDTGLEYASTNGFMHACGHDLHTAIGIGAARLLAARSEDLAGDVIIWFQPGEEGHGGADIMINEGALLVSGQKPIAAYGIHVFSKFLSGVFLTKPGVMMASSGDMIVNIKGAGGHGSTPWLAKEPVSVLLEAATALQTLITKKFSAFDPVILNIGWIRAGDTATTNVVPDSASFGATIRTFSDENFHRIRSEAKRLIEAIAAGFGLEAEIEFSPATRVLKNAPASVDRVERVIGKLLGDDRFLPMVEPIAGGEDFASILAEVPGAFVFLGASPADHDPAEAAFNHSNKAVFDDGVIGDAAALLAALAIDTLNEPSAS